MDFFAPGSKNDWRWMIGFLLFVVFLFASRAIREKDAASMQRTSFGTIIDCERSGRGGYFCKYVFPVDGEQHTGGSRSDSYLLFGQTAVIYYYSQNPTISALENFSQQARRDRNFVFVFLSMIAALVAYVLYSKAADRKNSKQQTA